MIDPRHRQLPGSKDHLQLRQQVKAYLPFFLVITSMRFIPLSVLLLVTTIIITIVLLTLQCLYKFYR